MSKYKWITDSVPIKLIVKQVYGVVFAEDGKIILRLDEHKYKLTGGHPEEKDKCFEDTLKREFMEELNVEIQDIYYLGYLLVDDDNTQYAQVRMVAKIKKINDRRPDTDNGKIYQRYIANQNNVKNYLDYKDSAGRKMIEDAIKMANEKYQFCYNNDKEYFV